MKKIFLSYLKTKELYLIAQIILQKAKNTIACYLYLQLVAKRMLREMEILEASFDRPNSEYTDALKEFDLNRDEMYRGFFGYVESFVKIGTLEQKKAAKYLLTILEGFGYEMARESYEVETVSMQKLQSMLAEPKAADAVNKIKAEAIVENLNSAETAFENLHNERNTEEVVEVIYPETKKAFSTLFTDTVNMLNAFDVLLAEAPNDELKKACDAINEYITDVMATARARKTRKENEKEGSEELETEENNV